MQIGICWVSQSTRACIQWLVSINCELIWTFFLKALRTKQCAPLSSSRFTYCFPKLVYSFIIESVMHMLLGQLICLNKQNIDWCMGLRFNKKEILLLWGILRLCFLYILYIVCINSKDSKCFWDALNSNLKANFCGKF